MNYKHGSHSIYDLKYHVVFCTKYRYRILTGVVGERTRDLIREICRANYVDIISGSMSPDHVHLLLSVPPTLSLSKIMQYIKQLIASFHKKSDRKFMQLRQKFTLESKKCSTSSAWHKNSHFWTCECIVKTNWSR